MIHSISHHQQRIRGFSLIEILLVIGLIAVLALAAFVIYPRVQAQQQADAEVRTIFTVISSLEGLVGVGGNYRGLSNLVINRAGFIPAAWNNGNQNTAVITNRFGGTVQFIDTAGGAGGCSATYCRGMRIDFHDVPSEVCLLMVPMLRERFRWLYVRPAVSGSAWYIIQRPTTTYPNPKLREIEACTAADDVTFLMAT